WTIVVLRRNALPHIGIEVLEISRGHIRGTTTISDTVDYCHGWFSQDGYRRHNDLEILRTELASRQGGFVRPGNEHITHATLNEGGSRSARTGIQHQDVLVQVRDELAGALLGAPLLAQRISPCGQIVPAGATGGLGIRSNDPYAWLDQIIPVADVLGIALAHQEYDGGGVRRTVLRQTRLPTGRNIAGHLADGVNVVGQGERDDVGLQPVDDGTRLRSRATVRLVDG